MIKTRRPVIPKREFSMRSSCIPHASIANLFYCGRIDAGRPDGSRAVITIEDGWDFPIDAISAPFPVRHDY
jgi:hypothetical protein